MDCFRVLSKQLKKVQTFRGFWLLKVVQGKMCVNSLNTCYLDPYEPFKIIKSLTPPFVEMSTSDYPAYWTNGRPNN